MSDPVPVPKVRDKDTREANSPTIQTTIDSAEYPDRVKQDDSFSGRLVRFLFNPKEYPSYEEGREAIQTGVFKGSPIERFTAEDASQVWSTQSTQDVLRMFNKGEPMTSVAERANQNEFTRVSFARAALASGKSPLIGLGFDPSIVVIDDAGSKLTAAGFYVPDEDYIWWDPDYTLTLAHESIHRSMKILRDKGVDVDQILKEVEEESLVRTLMKKLFTHADWSYQKRAAQRLEDKASDQAFYFKGYDKINRLEKYAADILSGTEELTTGKSTPSN